MRGLTDGTGTVTGSSDYAIFGSPRNQTGTTSRFGFTGEPTDATTGDVYLRARHYDPSTGRFLSADTVQPNAPGTQGYNRYAYVANNPMRYTDPTGHTISDVEEGIKTLGGLIAQVVVLADVFRPLLMSAFALGPYGLLIGLLFYLLIMLLIAQIFAVIGEILELITDPFDHFEGDRPTDDVASTDPGGLPQEPDDGCE